MGFVTPFCSSGIIDTVTIRINEIFPSLACYSQQLNFFEKKINTSSVKQSGEDKIRLIFLKSDIYDPFNTLATEISKWSFLKYGGQTTHGVIYQNFSLIE